MHCDCLPTLLWRSDKSTILLGLSIPFLLLATPARPQVLGYGRSSAPVYGGTARAALPKNPFPPMRGTYEESHKTSDGKPCISVSATSRHQVVNPIIIDQIVTVTNICGQPIRVQVCYIKSSDCIIVPLQAYQRLERILGIDSVSTDFSYEYRELF